MDLSYLVAQHSRAGLEIEDSGGCGDLYKLWVRNTKERKLKKVVKTFFGHEGEGIFAGDVLYARSEDGTL